MKRLGALLSRSAIATLFLVALNASIANADTGRTQAPSATPTARSTFPEDPGIGFRPDVLPEDPGIE